jgi:hypothetical protein
MGTCKYCGEEIEFRYIDGRCVPIHPGGGWECSGSGSSTRIVDYHRPREWAWRNEDFCRPTTCPECGEKVYFIRHNGGSVWVDELGWPWPKHACFDKPNEPTRTFAAWSTEASGLTNPKLGVITRIKTDALHTEPRLEIRLNNSTRLSLTLRDSAIHNDLLGELVVVSREDNLLLHPTYGEIPFYNAVEMPADINGWIQCPRCNAWVQADHADGHEEHCRKNYRPRKDTKPGKSNQPPRKPADTKTDKPFILPQLAASNAAKEERIHAEIERIAVEAWNNVAGWQATPETMLRLAKHEALQSFRMLSPSIRREVEHHFTSQKWMPLISRKPK